MRILIRNGGAGALAAAERRRTAGGESCTTLFLTLLRGSRYPDPRQDQGRQRCTWSLLPHDGDPDRAGVAAEGYRLNLPVRFVTEGTLAASAAPVVEVDGEGVVVEAVKLADDGSGDVVVRLYESRGGQSDVTLRPGFAAGEIVATDAHESTDTRVRRPDLTRGDDGVRFRLRPFQIATVRIRPA